MLRQDFREQGFALRARVRDDDEGGADRRRQTGEQMLEVLHTVGGGAHPHHQEAIAGTTCRDLAHVAVSWGPASRIWLARRGRLRGRDSEGKSVRTDSRRCTRRSNRLRNKAAGSTLHCQRSRTTPRNRM